MQNSKIEWTDATWNPVRGCSLVSSGCTNCYAMKMAHRFSTPGLPYEGLTRMTNHGPVWNGNIKLVEDVLTVPFRTKKPTKFFVNSMSDLFHEGVPFEFVDRVFGAMALSPQHIFQVLTKRPERMLEYFQSRENGFCDGPDEAWYEFSDLIHGKDGKLLPHLKKAGWGFYRCREEAKLLYEGPLPLPNVWLGVSAENQKTADERIPLLLQVPAAVRFLSCEPLLGPVNLSNWIGPLEINDFADRCGHFNPNTDVNNGYGCAHPDQEEQGDGCGKCYAFSCPISSSLSLSEPLDTPIYDAFGLNDDDNEYVMPHTNGLHWVIAGGESGHGARPMHPDWVRTLRNQCQAAGVAFFFKQWGAWLPWEPDTQPPFWNSQAGHFVDVHHNILDPETNDVSKGWDDGMWCIDENLSECSFQNVGKQAAGRLLDGKTHDEFPARISTGNNIMTT